MVQGKYFYRNGDTYEGKYIVSQDLYSLDLKTDLGNTSMHKQVKYIKANGAMICGMGRDSIQLFQNK